MSLGKILWVDDEIDSLHSHILFLENKGYEVNAMTNGLDAIDFVKENPVDVVLLDETMPGISGLETLAKIAEAMEISLADFFPGSDTPQDRETRKILGELSEEEIRFLAEIKKYSTTLSDEDKKLVLAMIRKMATIAPPVQRKIAARRPAY